MRLPIEVPDHVAVEVLHDEAVLLNLKTGIYFTLNETGTRAWQLLTACSDLNAVVSRMAEEFDCDSRTIESDLLSLVGKLGDKGLLNLAEGT